jgi:hypothetical protein
MSRQILNKKKEDKAIAGSTAPTVDFQTYLSLFSEQELAPFTSG